VVDLELVDDPALGSHLRLERGLVELAAEPAQRTLGLALHHTEQANGLLRHVGAVEDRGGRLQGQPAAGRVVDVQHATRVPSEPSSTDPVLGRARPQPAVDQHDGDASDLRQASTAIVTIPAECCCSRDA
jgi:hypothetical protein